MNPFDVVIVVVLGFCLIRGLFRGLIKELSSIIGVLGGFYAAYTYYAEVAKYLSRWISDIPYLNIASFLAVFCGVLFIISVLGVAIKYILNIAYMGWIDRLFGVVFGMIKAVLIASVLLIALTAFLPKGDPVIQRSVLSPYVTLVSERMAKIVPEKMKNEFKVKIEELKKTWKKQR